MKCFITIFSSIYNSYLRSVTYWSAGRAGERTCMENKKTTKIKYMKASANYDLGGATSRYQEIKIRGIREKQVNKYVFEVNGNNWSGTFEVLSNTNSGRRRHKQLIIPTVLIYMCNFGIIPQSRVGAAVSVVLQRHSQLCN